MKLWKNFPWTYIDNVVHHATHTYHSVYYVHNLYIYIKL